MKEFIYKEESYRIIGALSDIANEHIAQVINY